MEHPFSHDDKQDDKDTDAVLKLKNDKTGSSLKVHFQSSAEEDDDDDDNLVVGISSKQHKSSSSVNAELTTSLHDEEHASMPAVVAASTNPSANRPQPALPNPLSPTTRVVKRPASQRATNRRPGAYSIDGMDASTDGSRLEDFDEYDSVAPTASREFRRSARALISGRFWGNGEEAPSPIAHDKKQCSPFCISKKSAVILFVVLLVIGVAVGVGVGVGSKGKSSISASTGALGSCDFRGQEQPSVLDQCKCYDHVKIISTSLSQRYQSLLTTLVPLVIPGFQGAADSCSPANQALLWLAANDTQVDLVRSTNRFVLLLLYITWGGPEWRHNHGWASSTDECSWFGVTCRQQIITQLSLCNNSFAADSRIPSELFTLTGLVSITLASNSIVGTLPSSISKLSNLEYLNIANNKLVASFPFSQLETLKSLAGIDFSYNSFSGSLSSTIGNLTKLKSVLGSNNQISGSIPTELALATKLVTFDLVYNAIMGTIPTEVGGLTNLEWFTVGGPLSGSVPTEIGRLVKLRVLAITSPASMVGHIPTELASLVQLETLGLPGNHLSGSIPSALGKCVHLVSLNLQQNALTGTIPRELGLISSLAILDASNNNLQGDIPSDLFNLPLQILNLASNNLNGSLPFNVGNATQLQCLDVTSNHLVEFSPAGVCQQLRPTLQKAAADCSAHSPQLGKKNSTGGVDGCPCCNCLKACSTVETSSALQFSDSCNAFNL